MYRTGSELLAQLSKYLNVPGVAASQSQAIGLKAGTLQDALKDSP